MTHGELRGLREGLREGLSEGLRGTQGRTQELRELRPPVLENSGGDSRGNSTRELECGGSGICQHSTTASAVGARSAEAAASASTAASAVGARSVEAAACASTVASPVSARGADGISLNV